MAEEKDFENKVKDFLKNECQAFFVKYWGGGRFTKSGIPDLLVCINGYFMGVELKASDGKPSKLQCKKLIQIVRADGMGLCLYPKDFEAFKEFCQRIRCGEIPVNLYDTKKYEGFLWDWYFIYDDIL